MPYDAAEDFIRDIAGAAISFDEFGSVESISLPTDSSIARITGLPAQSTQQMVADVIRELQLEVAADCIRIPNQDSKLGTMAVVKVKDPLFARNLSDKVRRHASKLQVTPLPIDSKHSNARKVYISWHKPTRTVWLNIVTGNNPNVIAERFKKGEYKILGQAVKATAEKATAHGLHKYYNPVARTVILSDVPGEAKFKDIGSAIRRQTDKPAHIEMGKPSYVASDAEVSVDVRSRLEQHGPLESFYMPSTHYGKRVKAIALFRDEADARSSCSLNNTQIHMLGKGKVTVTLIQGVKCKVSTTIYTASRSRVDQESQKWREQHLTFRVYHDIQKHFTTLKVEGDDANIVANARKVLEGIFRGTLLVTGGLVLWNTGLNNNGSAYKKLKAIEKEFDVVISRDKSKRQLHYHGPPDKLDQTVLRVADLLKEETATMHDIDLNPVQFAWAIRGGFKSIQHTLGGDVAVFDIISKKIAIHGTDYQHQVALDMLNGNCTTTALCPTDQTSITHKDCPICFCEAENPISTSCNHIYCLECFEECCKATASSGTVAFQVKCQGDEGKCSHVFTLRELRDSISSAVFETVLQYSFEDHIKQRPDLFHYCPTPDCDHIYRCTISSGADRPTHTCSNCLELVCTSCHALHGRYTCAEYKDIQSGGYEALEKLKKELNIKDCPKCSTPMEKTEGCNHMTCGGCKAHICWVCMGVFSTGPQCYDHMSEKHGGIGLGLERFMY
ncbi:hypothetical protein SLS60_007034 [Paraconiothyrium brasiliense]|uniref:RING-type domain-containing protein n=1 Tax=Paraconiothyrium brasiliense TaxID=300254 RepID=A0ABR3R884_9PLEO